MLGAQLVIVADDPTFEQAKSVLYGLILYIPPSAMRLRRMGHPNICAALDVTSGVG